MQKYAMRGHDDIEAPSKAGTCPTGRATASDGAEKALVLPNATRT
jgi:hypothetical protein